MEQHQRDSDRCIRPARYGFALLEHSQLFAQEEIPGSECALRTQGKPEECGQVAEQCDFRFDAFHDGQHLVISWRSARFEGNCNLSNYAKPSPPIIAIVFLIHDRDGIFSTRLDHSITHRGIRVLKSPPRTPKASSRCDRVNRIPMHLKVVVRPILGGLDHDYGLLPNAA